jgi:lactate dehydrogenase-like 2-hydroxyacid dehydrogenase
MGLPIRDQVSGIVGLGRIGSAIACIMKQGFDNEILYASRAEKPELEDSLDARRRALDDLLAESDFVFVVVPLTAGTRNLLNERNLKLLRQHAIVVNVSRAGVIDDRALLRLLAEERLFGAGLDVYDAAARDCDHPNLVLTAHMANGENRAMRAAVELAVGNIAAVLGGRQPMSPVSRQDQK